MDLALEDISGLSIILTDHVSILVFVDLALEVNLEASYLGFSVRFLFQSLFSWIWLSKRIFSSFSPPMISFNPCFRGSGSRRNRISMVIDIGLFQSLFSWIWLSKRAEFSPFLPFLGRNWSFFTPYLAPIVLIRTLINACHFREKL